MTEFYDAHPEVEPRGKYFSFVGSYKLILYMNVIANRADPYQAAFVLYSIQLLHACL